MKRLSNAAQFIMPGSLETDNFPTNGAITVSGYRIASHAAFDQQFNNI